MGCVSSRKDWSEEDSSGRKLRVGQSLLLPHSYPCCLKGSIGGVQCAATIHRWQCKIIYSELICAEIYCWHTLRMAARSAGRASPRNVRTACGAARSGAGSLDTSVL